MTSAHPADGHGGAGPASGEEHIHQLRPAGAHAGGAGEGAPRSGSPFLRYLDDCGEQRVYVLDQDRPVTIGRAEAADVWLAWDRSVSSLHAEAYPLGTHWLIGDEGISRNGTFVNNERVSGRRRLRHGDVVRVGRTELTYSEVRSGQRDTTTIADVAGMAQTVSLLFTDVVGSTELMDRLGDDESDRLRGKHFATLRAAAAEHGGREVKSLGDGLMVVFASALSAVGCAVTMQQRIAAANAGERNERLGLRIGLNAGEVVSAEQDYFGTPVVVARRLCDRASSGQVLCSEVVRALVGSRGGHRFVPLGATPLKGFADPLPVFELDWRSRRASPTH